MMSRPKKQTAKLNPLEHDLLEGVQAMLAHIRGEAEYPSYHYTVPEEVDVKAIRHNLHLTQMQFAQLISASVHAVRHWENGRRKPDGTARTLLLVLQHNPYAVFEALNQKSV